MGYLFMHQDVGIVSPYSQKFLKENPPPPDIADDVYNDLLVFEGLAIMLKHNQVFELSAMLQTEWWKPHVKWLEELAYRVYLLADAERSVVLHKEIVNPCTSGKERMAAYKIFMAGVKYERST